MPAAIVSLLRAEVSCKRWPPAMVDAQVPHAPSRAVSWLWIIPLLSVTERLHRRLNVPKPERHSHGQTLVSIRVSVCGART